MRERKVLHTIVGSKFIFNTNKKQELQNPCQLKKFSTRQQKRTRHNNFARNVILQGGGGG